MAGAKSLGQLTLDVIAKIGGFVTGMSQAERQADKSAKEITKSIQSIGIAGHAVGYALGGFLKDGITAAVNVFPDLINQAAQFQDIAEKTGGSAEGFAGLAVAAKVGGTSMEELTAASIKLTQNLTGVDDESKAAGAALTALGIPIAEFKKLAPEDQIVALANALGQFRDGAGKTAVAVAALGKSGAQLLPTLKEIYNQGGLQKILTDEQIQQSDDYLDKQTRLRAELGLLASAIATQFIGPMNELTKVLINVGKEILGVSGKASDLGANTGLRDFAQAAAVSSASTVERLQTVVEAMLTVDRTAQLVGKSARLAFEAANLVNPAKVISDLASGTNPLASVKEAYANNEAAFKNLSESFQKTVDAAKGKETKKLKELFELQNLDSADPAIARMQKQAQQIADAKKKQLDFGGAVKPDKKGGGATDDPTKKLLDNDLKAYQAQADAAKDLLADRNKILDLYNQQGLISVKDYYAALQGNLDEATATQMKSYDDQLKALQDYQAKAGKETDKADAQGKINDLLTKQAKLQKDSGNAAIEMGIKQQQAMRAYQDSIGEVNAKILEMEGNLGKAAEIRFDVQNRQLRQLAEASGDVFTVKQIDRLREYTKAQADISAAQAKFTLEQGDLSIAEERITIARERGAIGEIESLRQSGEARKKAVAGMQQQLDKLLEINEAGRSDEQRQQIERLKLQLEGLKATIDPLADKFNTMFSDAAGSAFADFVTGTKTAKEAFKSFTDSVFRNFTDLISKDLANQFFKSFLGGESGGLGGLISKAFGGGTAIGGAGSASSAVSTTSAATATTSLAAAATSAAAALTALTSVTAASGSASLTGAFGSLASSLSGANSVGDAGGDALGAFIKLAGFKTGGFTGMGAANDPAGIVHKGEYVLNAEQTRRIGVANLDRGNFGGNMIFNMNVPDSLNRNTGSQIAAEAQRKLIQGSRNT